MTASERWRRVQELCETLEEVPPGDHVLHLLRLEPDEGLRREALSLLEAIHEEETLQAHHVRATASIPEALPGAIAGLRFLGVLGAGGSSVVHSAIRTVNETEQRVAVKIFHANRTSDEQRKRFVREQRILASLNHPGIVRFLDAGITDDGRPFLTMELAEGEPITQYCDRERLRVRDRVRLMLSVCESVQAAHRLLVVHLDLKPSNILVTREGQVKLLDFGTAQLMEAGGDLAMTEHLTPLYASPERLRGEAISVTCDVYALGLILYETLAGAWPFQSRDSIVSVAERAAGTTELRPLPERVTPEAAELRSTTRQALRSSLAGDLAAICAKALTHNPAARYDSVAHLADDLRRYLDGEPVLAHAQGWAYWTRKFVQRHAWSIAAASLFIVGLASAAAYSYVQTQRARREAIRAATAKNFLSGLLEIGTTDAGARRDMTVRELLEIAGERVDSELGQDPVMAADVETSLAEGFIGQSTFPRAQALLERAFKRVEAPPNYPLQARIKARLGYLLYVQNQYSMALDYSIAVQDLWKQHRELFTPAEAASALLIASATLAYLKPGDSLYRGYLEEAVALSQRHPADVNSYWRASCLTLLATAYVTADFRPAEAYKLLGDAIAIQRADRRQSGSLGDTLQILGIATRYLGKFEESEAAHRESYSISKRLSAPDSPSSATIQAHWAMSLADLGRLDDAYRESQQALATKRRWYPEPGSYLLWSNLHAAAYSACLLHHYSQCEALAREALLTLGTNPSPKDYRFHDVRAILALSLAGLGRKAEARPLLESSLRFNHAIERTLPIDALLRDTLAQTQSVSQ